MPNKHPVRVKKIKVTSEQVPKISPEYFAQQMGAEKIEFKNLPENIIIAAGLADLYSGPRRRRE